MRWVHCSRGQFGCRKFAKVFLFVLIINVKEQIVDCSLTKPACLCLLYLNVHYISLFVYSITLYVYSINDDAHQTTVALYGGPVYWLALHGAHVAACLPTIANGLSNSFRYQWCKCCLYVYTVISMARELLCVCLRDREIF